MTQACVGRTLLAGVALVTLATIPGGAQATSMADALVQAYNSSPELVAARSNVKVRSERAYQARSFGLPQISGQLSSSVQYFDLDEFFYPQALSLNATVPLYTGGQVENSVDAAETRITAEEARLLATEQSILLNTITAYSNVLRDQTLVDLGINNVSVITEQLRAARERFEVGEVTRTDVAQAEARLASAQSLLVSRRGALQNSREGYKRVVGVYPDELDPPPPIPDLPANFDEALAIAAADEPRLRAARLDRIAASSDVRASIGSLLPQVGLTGRVAYTDTLDRDLVDDRTDATVGVLVNIPIWSGGLNYSRIRERQNLVEARDGDVSTALRNAVQNVGTSWSNLDVAQASIEAAKLEIRAAEIAYRGVQEEAKVGARTTLDVLDAEQELLNARADLVVSRRDEYVSSWNILFSIGKLTVDHLGLDVDKELDVDGYYDTVRDRYFGYDETDETVWSLSYRP